MKSWRYQIIGGSCDATIGLYVIDASMLQLAGVSKDLWRPADFASDLLVLKLASFKTIQKLHKYQSDASSDFIEGDIGSLMVTLVTIRLCLHAINSKGLPAKHRAVFSWLSMVWFTSIDGACTTTK